MLSDFNNLLVCAAAHDADLSEVSKAVDAIRSVANFRLSSFADVTCACTSVACAELQLHEFALWLPQNAHARGNENAATADMARMLKCAKRLHADLSEVMAAVNAV